MNEKDDTGQQEDDEFVRGRATHAWVLGSGCVLVSLAFYVLSVGPAAWLIGRYPGLADAFEVIYAPVEWLHENTILKEPLRDYVDLWTQ